MNKEENGRAPKILIIGLDGATFDLLDPWCSEGYLPNISKLILSGVSGSLQSTVPPLTSPAWVSFATGKSPEKLGIFDLVYKERNSYNVKPVNSTLFRGETIWELMSNEGFRVGVVNFPVTYPPYNINGFMVTCMFTPPGAPFTYPKELSKEIKRKLGHYRIEIEDFLNLYTNDKDAFLKACYEILDQRVELVKYLIKKKWQIFAVVFTITDRVQHVLWKYMDPNHVLYNESAENMRYKDAILNLWIRLDEKIGDILKRTNKKTVVMLVSDHGFGPINKLFLVDDWLQHNKFLKIRTRKSGKLVNRALYKLGITREGLGTILKKVYLRDLFSDLPIYVKRLIPTKHIDNDFHEWIDWSKTKAFSFGCTGKIYINTKGREPQGIVAPGTEYLEVVNKIKTKLKHLCKNDNLDIEIFKPKSKNDPDLLFCIPGVAFDKEINRTHKFVDKKTNQRFLVDIPEDRPINADHRMNGIFIASGPHIREGFKLDNPKIIDIAPTILHILDVPIPKDFDGRVLKEIFEPDSSLAKREVQYQLYSERATLQRKIRRLARKTKVA